MQLIKQPRYDDRGSALFTALMSTLVMLALGLALLAVVDTQAQQSTTERTRDRGFNLAESVLTSEAFVLGRNWPASAVTSGTGTTSVPVERNCSDAAAGVSGNLSTAAAAGTPAALIHGTLRASFTDAAFAGATWQVNVCDNAASAVWDDALLTNGTKNWDKNGDNKVWVRAQATVDGRTRALAGLVQVRSTAALPSKYGLATGNVTDDLGSTVNNLSTNALGGVLSGLLGTTPTVAPDPTAPAPASGVTGLRCGVTDIQDGALCITGTIASVSALPVVSSLLTGNAITQIPTVQSTDDETIAQLRAQAVASHTYVATSPGSASYASAPACNLTGSTAPAGTRSRNTIVFIEQVGTTGTSGTAGGPGDQYCFVNVGSPGLAYKALIVGSGRVILRGNNTPTAPAGTATTPSNNMFYGVVYALNRQRLTTAQGGRGLGDAANSREVLVIDQGAHVKGAVHADGKSAKVTIVPPPLTVNTNALVDSLIPCTGLVSCLLNTTVKVVGGVLDIVNRLISEVGLGPVVNGLLNQLNPQRASYGSAITSDVATANALTVYSASGVIPGTFKDLNPTG
ncbi:hypothetical protein DSM112329_03093 [Paraconexibacter sp. AEG42_29]|uniref:Type 4 fimbrial biogenesis protein PilX N-terminal domain-containing protein n=1 Tax=Paraconexibacter sp. AEG42_29 TaxID=2997339 RepID=A0AAU7AX67_9ACTN